MNTSVNIAGIIMKNPVTVASGTFGSGIEYSEFIDISRLGAITTKGVSKEPWEGNATPRIAETYGGMLNAVGLQNPGVDLFIKRDLSFLEKQKVPVFVNICGKNIDEYCEMVECLSECSVDMFELNVSCPNVKAGGINLGQNPKELNKMVKRIKLYSKKPISVKLTPNITDITELAKAVEDAGADAISMINTLSGMKIDINTRKYVLANKIGGLSGPAIKPVAVRMINQVYESAKIPIIGMGGISCFEDAIEFMLAGATAVAVGTANFYNPYATMEIIEGIEKYMLKHKIDDINEIIGCVVNNDTNDCCYCL